MIAATARGAIGFRLAHELEGILTGIAADGVIHPDETARLHAWLAQNVRFANIHPFSELVEYLQRALADGVLTFEETQDLLFVTAKYTTGNVHFDAVRGGLQALMGLLTGVSADATINDHEVAMLGEWLQAWSHLRGLWPYDECCAIVSALLATRRLDSAAEHLERLTRLFPPAGSGDVLQMPLTLDAVCATTPAITFTNRLFVFTGLSQRGTPQERGAPLALLGGREQREVGETADYLVVCAGDRKFCAFSAYGRAVEKAIAMRRSGHAIQIVRETDFWDALARHGAAH
jgi:hypothetical protein